MHEVLNKNLNMTHMIKNQIFSNRTTPQKPCYTRIQVSSNYKYHHLAIKSVSSPYLWWWVLALVEAAWCGVWPRLVAWIHPCRLVLALETEKDGLVWWWNLSSSGTSWEDTEKRQKIRRYELKYNQLHIWCLKKKFEGGQVLTESDTYFLADFNIMD